MTGEALFTTDRVVVAVDVDTGEPVVIRTTAEGIAKVDEALEVAAVTHQPVWVDYDPAMVSQ